jgi:hypothetical protein
MRRSIGLKVVVGMRSVLRSKDTSPMASISQSNNQLQLKGDLNHVTTRDTTVPRPSSNLSPLPPYSTVAGIRAIDMSGCAI